LSVGQANTFPGVLRPRGAAERNTHTASSVTTRVHRIHTGHANMASWPHTHTHKHLPDRR